MYETNASWYQSLPGVISLCFILVLVLFHNNQYHFIALLGVISLWFHFIPRCCFFVILFLFKVWFLCDFISFLGVVSLQFHSFLDVVSLQFLFISRGDFISFLGVVSLRFHFYISRYFNLIDYLIILMVSNLPLPNYYTYALIKLWPQIKSYIKLIWHLS